MRRGTKLALGCLLVAAVALTPAAIAAPAADVSTARPPNIVVIVADDLGFSDLGSYGGEIETPALDRLALEGVRFTQFYATPRCSPTRAALLTGVWPHEAGVAHLDRDFERAAYRGSIHDTVPTLAERLRGLGYATYMAGKWHLSPERLEASSSGLRVAGDEAAPASWPLQRGFDSFYGLIGGSGSYFDPEIYDGNQRAPWPPSRSAAGETPYLTDVLGDRAAAMITDHLATSPDQPFFLYLPWTAPHWPLHAPAASIEHYRGRFDAGWDALRAARFERQRELEIVPRDSVLPPRDPRVPAWDETPDRDWQARRMEVYAAMVTAMDHATASVIEAIERAGAIDDTVILFLSDNGACGEEFNGLYALAPLVAPVPEQTGDGRAMRFGDRPEIEPGPADTYTTYGRAWAHLSNTPLRRYKHWTHEGGIHVPFFVHWPARLAARAGAIIHTPANVVDVVPTLLEVARGSADAAAAAQADAIARGAPPLRGESLLPLLRGEETKPRTFYWEHEGNRAILDGSTKLVARWLHGWELYDLAVDPFETDDLAAAHPDQVDALAVRWSAWAQSVGVETWPLVVPMVSTAINVAVGLLALAIVAGRALGARRSGAAPRSPGPFSGGGRHRGGRGGDDGDDPGRGPTHDPRWITRERPAQPQRASTPTGANSPPAPIRPR